MSIQGFKVEDSVLRYDYNSLDNVPILSDELLVSSDGSVKGFKIKAGTSENIEKYDYESLDNIPPVEEFIEDIKSTVFIDLLDGVTLQPGYIQTGGDWSDNQSANNLEIGTKDFISVTPGYALLYNAIYTERPWGAIAFYDKNKMMVGTRMVLNNLVSHIVCIVPENAIYVRVCFSSKYLKSKYVGQTASQETIFNITENLIHSDIFPFIGSGDLDLQTLLANKYITINSGNEANYNGYSATTFLTCYGMHKFIATITDGDGLAQHWFYDKNKNPLSHFVLPMNGSIEIEVPSDAYYVRFSNRTAAMDTLKIEWWLKKDYTDKIIEYNDILETIGRGTLDLKELMENKYITISTGKEANYNGYSATNYLICHYLYRLKCTITNGDGYAEHWFYDKNKTPISGFALPKTGSIEIEIPSNAYYVRFSNKTEAMETLKVEWNTTNVYESNNIITTTQSLEKLIIQSKREYRPWNSEIIIPKPLVFSVITDIHGDAENLHRYIEFCEHYSNYIDEKLCLGDMVVSFFSSDITFWDNMENTDDILRTIGNHDVWLSYDRPIQNASKIDAYAKYYTGKISKWDIIQPSNAETNGLMYYYKDYASQKLRLVVTDCMYWDNTEKTWFTNVLNDAKTNGYSVLCTSHYNLSKTDLTPIANFYSSDIGSSQLVTNWGANDAIEVVDNFITGGGEFVGWLSGDSHYDYCAVYTHPISGNKQVTLTLENAWCNQAWNDSNRVRGTQTQDSFNLISIDTYSKLIKVLRIGNCYDRLLRSKKYFVYNYENHTLISSL